MTQCGTTKKIRSSASVVTHRGKGELDIGRVALVGSKEADGGTQFAAEGAAELLVRPIATARLHRQLRAQAINQREETRQMRRPQEVPFVRSAEDDLEINT